MKENKNLVFALTSLSGKDDASLEPDGYLLFPDEERAMYFMDLCKNVKKHYSLSASGYHKYTWVKVNDFLGDRVHAQKNFFVTVLEELELSEEDKALIANQAPLVVDTEESVTTEENKEVII